VLHAVGPRAYTGYSVTTDDLWAAMRALGEAANNAEFRQQLYAGMYTALVQTNTLPLAAGCAVPFHGLLGEW
jgi:hypothetical protein